MDIITQMIKQLNLPDDMIKNIESYVDKSPPFAKELLNYKFKKYYWDDDDDIFMDEDDFEIHSFEGSRMNFTFGVEGSNIILYEDILGYKRIDWNYWLNEPCYLQAGHWEWDSVNISTLGLILRDEIFDEQLGGQLGGQN